MRVKQKGVRSNGGPYQKASRWLMVVVVCLLTTGLVLGQGDSKKEELKRIETFKKANISYKKGLTSFSKGDLKKADTYFVACIKIFPEHAGAYFYRSKVLYKQGKLQDAEGNIITAIQSYDAFVNMNKAVFKRTQAKYADARADARHEGGRGSFMNRRSLRESQAESSKHMKKAREDYQKYLASVDLVRADYHFQHGQIHFKLKKAQPAVVEFLQAIKLNPKHTLAYNNLASILYMTKNYKAASDIIKQAEMEKVTINPQLVEAVNKKVSSK